MPRVSPEHRDARRRQILDAARRCFARKGFHATSMHDVLTEADLSAGAVYRYFDSKDDLIAAVANDGLAVIAAAFDADEDAAAPPLDVLLVRVLAALERLASDQDLPSIALHAWAEALRSPPVHRSVTGTIDVVHQRLALAVAAHQERAGGVPAVPADDVARALTGLLGGYIVQYALLGPTAAAGFRDGLRALLAGEVARYATEPGGTLR